MLERVTFLVSHFCNLKCTYCYAGGGNYGSTEELMSTDIAIGAFNHFISLFGEIKEIYFFGGEPLLGLDVIEDLCTYCEMMFVQKKILAMPTFLIVTNGTLISDRVLDLAKRFKWVVTVSLDGPDDFHNIHRKNKKGEGSFSHVMNGIKALQSASIPYSLECTYTHEHWNNGITPLELYKYFKSLGAQRIMWKTEIPAVSERWIEQANNPFANSEEFQDSIIDLLTYSLHDCLDNDTLFLHFLAEIFDAIINQPEYLLNRYCGGDFNTLAVNPNGLVFPCHMFNNQSDFCYGYYEDVVGISEKLPQKNDNDLCRKCPIKNICKSCPAYWYLTNIATNNPNSLQPIDSQCRFMLASYTMAKLALTKEFSIT